ncbi:hypothetical protein V5F77_22970 [Xanthobacter sp. DSM 24535]|uniref:hypothetical protein n=1 Tax=Roseixanthobacter psychrophilus TaxID=3119917 RepID=UPI0037278888
MSAAWEATEIVLFDVSETLFIRPLVEPEHLFDLVGATVGIAEFRARRLAAEALARRQVAEGGDQPVTLDRIYERLEATPAQRDLAKRTEYRFELALWRPDLEPAQSFREMAAAGRAVLTGRTHLPAAFFEELLVLHGLPVAPVFFYGDEHAAPLSQLIADDLNVPPHRILPFSKAETAQEVPLADPAAQKAEGIASLAFGLRRFAEALPQESCEALGFRIVGPALAGFTHWLSEQARRDRIDLLLFCPGPGTALEQIAAAPHAPLLPRHAYFAVGATAIMLAGTHDRNFDARVDLMVAGAHGLRTFELLERFGIPVPAAFMMADLGLGDEVVIDPSTEPLLRRFLGAYRWEILKIARRNRRGLFRDLLALGLGPQMRVGLVDLGWEGHLVESMTLALEHIFEVEIHGYSLCLLDTPESRRRQGRFNLKGMLSRATLPADTLGAIGANRAAIELLFTAPHREVIGLEDLPGAIVRIEGPLGPSSRRLAAVSSEVTRGAVAFATLFNAFCDRAGFEPNPIEASRPFLVVAADDGVAGPVASALEQPDA